MSESTVEKISINGVSYVREGATSPPASGNRAVVVVDRGWIFAGDVTEEDGRVMLTRAVWVFNWSSIGFDGVLKDPKNENVNLRKLDHAVDIPADSEIFRVLVDDNWGL